MCIAIITTAHPDYALIIANNRDEFIARPTSQPHWWTRSPSPAAADSRPSHQHAGEEQHQILSSRDLWRPEHGTWLGVSRDGRVAVLTNYRDSAAAVAGAKSRGGIVSGWLAGDREKSVQERVTELVHREGGLMEYGGFTMVCGRLRPRRQEGRQPRTIEGLAVVSNRVDDTDKVAWISRERNETCVLSNTSFDDPLQWPKIRRGRELMEQTIASSSSPSVGDDDDDGHVLVESIFRTVLDDDALTPVFESTGTDAKALTVDESAGMLKMTVFVPVLGTMLETRGLAEGEGERIDNKWEQGKDFVQGAYGTQRQTVILVGWDGEVVYVERRLWDDHGRRVQRGEGDVRLGFKIDGWESGETARRDETIPVVGVQYE